MAVSDNNNANTSRNFDAEGNPLFPSVYEFEYIKFIKQGKEVDAAKKRLVTSLEIVEELYSPIVKAKIIIRDNENFFEEFGLNGQEVVKVGILRKALLKEQDDRVIELDLVVENYSLFEKTTESITVQEYHLNLISPIAFLSRLQQISQSVKGSPVDGIKDIFEKYLPIAKERVLAPGDSPGDFCQVNNLKTVITKRTPLQAIEWLRSCCYDSIGSPFFVFPSFASGNMHIKSWGSITNEAINPVYPKPYVFKPFKETVSDAAAGPGHLEELASKIISLRSDLSLNKLQNTLDGGGPASVTEIVDFNDRSYTDQLDTLKPEYKKVYNQDDPILDPISFNYLEKIEGVKGVDRLDNMFETAKKEVFYLPVSPYVDGYKASPEIKLAAKEEKNHYESTIGSITHDITIYGEDQLIPGVRIKIEVPKAVDTSRQEPGVDESLSGTYIVLVAVHTFKDGIYFTRAKITKDSQYNPKFNTEKR